jgi:RimJ/RimL family protein N-acetyltransferase
MDSLALIRQHMALECITVNDSGDLTRLSPCDGLDDIARLYVARHQDGYAIYFRDDMPETTRAQLLRLSPEALHTDYRRVCALLDCAEKDIFIGRSYTFPEITSPQSFPNVVYQEHNVCLIEMDGKTVSACSSSREDANSAEAWVYTEPEYQGRGYARQVTLAWAHRVREQGKTPFYSHKITNIVSQKVAESLGFLWYIDDVGYP